MFGEQQLRTVRGAGRSEETVGSREDGGPETHVWRKGGRRDILAGRVCGGGGRDKGVWVRSGQLRVVKLGACPSEKTGEAKDGEGTSVSCHVMPPWADLPAPRGHQERHAQTMAHRGRC